MPPLVLVSCLYCFAQAFSQGLQAKQAMGAYAGIGIAVAVVFLAVSLPLIGQFGAYSLITAMGAAFLTMLVLLQRVSERLLPVGYPWWRHGLMWAAAIGIVGVSFGIGISWQGLALKTCAVAAIIGLPFAFGAVSRVDVGHLWSMRPRLRA